MISVQTRSLSAKKLKNRGVSDIFQMQKKLPNNPKIVKKQEQKKNRIVRAAFNAVAKKGFNNLTVEDIAREAGISKGGVHYYFETKDDVMFEVMDAFFTFFTISLNVAIPRADRPVERLEEIINYCLRIALTQKEYIRILMDYWVQINFNEKLRKLYSKYITIYQGHLKQLIASGKEKGLVMDVDTDIAADIIFSGLLGFAIGSTWEAEIPEEEQKSRTAATAHHLMSILLK